MKQSMKFVFCAMILSFMMTSCEKDDPVIENEEELITTLTYTLTPTGGGVATVFSFVDLDGDGGVTPTITGGTLSANQAYTGSIVLLNESESPTENITEEVEEEASEHQFFFETTVAGLTITYNDEDGDGNPIGLQSNLTTTGMGSGTLTITLRHEPNKSADGVAGGNIANAGGETDIQVTFPMDVQ